jgi:hypothetical protein
MTKPLAALGLTFALALALGGSVLAAERPRSTADHRLAQTPALPPAVQICLLDGSLASRPAVAAVRVPHVGLATPSRAGIYDPHAPIVPRELNWTVPGVGCVSYPGDATAHDACGVAGGASLPVVHRMLCYQ